MCGGDTHNPMGTDKMFGDTQFYVGWTFFLLGHTHEHTKGGVDLTECDANFAPIFLFFIRMTSFLDIVGGMGPSLCIPSFMTIR